MKDEGIELNILIINQPLANRGDESAHRAFITRLAKEYPSACIRMLFFWENQSDVDEFNVNLPNVQYVNPKKLFCEGKFMDPLLERGLIFLGLLHPNVFKLFLNYLWADVVVCAPGGICMGGFQSWRHLIALKYAKLAHKPLVYYGRSFGPFPTLTRRNRKFRNYSIEMLRYFSFCSIRDRKTEELARSLGISFVSTVDSAFLGEGRGSIPIDILQRIGTEKYVVFVPNSLTWHFAYKDIPKETILQFFSKVADEIISAFPGCELVLLPQTYDFGGGMYGDIHFFHELMPYLPKDSAVILPDTCHSDVQQAIVAKAQCVVGARYHSIVFAINQAVPFVALSYEHKIAGLLETLGLSNHCVDIASCFTNEERVAAAVQEAGAIMRKEGSELEARRRAKRIAEDCFQKLRALLERI